MEYTTVAWLAFQADSGLDLSWEIHLIIIIIIMYLKG